jgi:hypothetical protein
MSGDRAQERDALQAWLAEDAIAYPNSMEPSRRLCSHGHINEVFGLRAFGNYSSVGQRKAKSCFSL